MAIVDQRTPKLDLPLPFVDNDLFDDVARLREAFNKIDQFAATGVSAAAKKLETARKINGVDFDGTAAITITAAANGGTSAACSGNSATATKLATPRTINGANFDGTQNIVVTAVANGGTSASCSGNSATATKLATARKINGVDFDGTAAITIADDTKLPTSGTAAAAVKLSTARTINGVAFDGSENINLPATPDATKLPLAGGRITGTDNATSTSTGAIQCAGGISAVKDIWAGGNVTAANVATPSDERLKDNIVSIEDALAKVRQIRGVMYTDKATGQRRTGVIAQELQKVIPEAVLQNGDYLAVTYGNLVGLLMSAVTELADRVDEITPRHKRSK